VQGLELIAKRAGVAVAGGVALSLLLVFSAALTRADEADTFAEQNLPIQFTADWSQEWTAEGEYHALFRGNCQVTQGARTYTAQQMVVWHRQQKDGAAKTEEVTVYLEGDVVIASPSANRTTAADLVELTSTAGISLTVRGRNTDVDGSQDALYERAAKRRSGQGRSRLLQTQLTVDPLPSPDGWQGVPLPSPGQAMRRVRVGPRSFSMPFSLNSFESRETNPPEQVVVITGGVNVVVEGVMVENLGDVGAIDLTADRVVIWTTALAGQEFSTEMLQTRDTPYQLYLEGNIVIRQGENVIRAQRAFYDAREERALILNAELRSYLPELDATVRLRADRIKQLSRTSYQAQNAWFSTSPYGRPGYRLQSSEIFYEERFGNVFGNDVPEFDPQTGKTVPATTPWVTATDSTFYVNEAPILYVPSLSAPAEDPNIPIESINFGQDRIFGTQIRTRWNAFQLFGLERPPGTKWALELDYLSDRGPAVGTDGTYKGVDAYGHRYQGSALGFYIYDDGHDNLGLDRRDLPPPDYNRGRTQLRHRHTFFNDLMLDVEVGYVSDRNFLEQYYEEEFDRGKDQETLGYLHQSYGNAAWTVLGRAQVNQFENNTQWMPKGDFYTLGYSFLDGYLNWSSHTTAGYGQLNQAKPPSDPNDLFTPLPYFASAEGLVASTRHELEMPLDLGPVRIAPYAMGEIAYWGDSLTGEAIDRYYGRAGVRASASWWRVFPTVQSEVFNLNGLAHKSTLDADFGYAESSRDLSEIAQFNEFDDDAQERFRERLVVNTFGGVLDPIYDPRIFAVRSGAATSVTSPTTELIDDQQAVRLNLSQRLQTKVGTPGQERIKDWMALDLGVSVFPDAVDDNFGETFGLFTTRYAWYVGDRTSIHASSLVDFFEDGPQLWSLGVLSQRSLRGSLYLGLRQIKAGDDLDSQILTASYSYAMSPKWVSTFTTAYDIGEGRNRGQSMTISRIGLDWILHLGANFDASKNNAGLGISLEPRFGARTDSTTQLGSLLGIRR